MSKSSSNLHPESDDFDAGTTQHESGTHFESLTSTSSKGKIGGIHPDYGGDGDGGGDGGDGDGDGDGGGYGGGYNGGYGYSGGYSGGYGYAGGYSTADAQAVRVSPQTYSDAFNGASSDQTIGSPNGYGAVVTGDYTRNSDGSLDTTGSAYVSGPKGTYEITPTPGDSLHVNAVTDDQGNIIGIHVDDIPPVG